MQLIINQLKWTLESSTLYCLSMFRVNLASEYYSIFLTMTEGRRAGGLKCVVQPMLFH